MASSLRVGIAYDLRSDFAEHALELSNGPDDRLEEYDGQETVNAIASVLERLGYRPQLLGGGRGLIEKVLRDAPDLVFNLAEGFGSRSREAHVPAVLEMLRIPFTHSDPLTLAATLDKAMAKRLVAAQGVPTPKFYVAQANVEPAAKLAFPVIAKPLFEGSSMGIRDASSRIADPKALNAHLQRLWRDYEQPVLVEEFCSGPEFTVGIVGTGPEARVLGCMEITPKVGGIADFVYSLEIKRNFKVDIVYHIPPARDAALVRQVEDIALQAYRTLECRDVARVDVRLSASGEPMFLEANPLPGLDPDKSDLIILARGLGMQFDDIIRLIVDSARKRYSL